MPPLPSLSLKYITFLIKSTFNENTLIDEGCDHQLPLFNQERGEHYITLGFVVFTLLILSIIHLLF